MGEHLSPGLTNPYLWYLEKDYSDALRSINVNFDLGPFLKISPLSTARRMVKASFYFAMTTISWLFVIYATTPDKPRNLGTRW